MAKSKMNKQALRSDRVGAQSGGAAIVRRVAPPKLMSTATGVRVRNQEYQFNIIQGTSTNVLLAFNPWSFDWLGAIAQNYAYYKLHKLSWTFVTSSPTTDSGQIQAGVFYERGEAKRWVTAPSADVLSQCQQYFRAPIWGGLGVQSEGGFTQNGCTIVVDTQVAHMRTKNFIVSSLGQGTDLDAEYNQAIGAYFPFSWSSSAVGTPRIGTIYVSYDVEFFHPTANSYNLLLKSAAVPGPIIRCERGVELPPGSKCSLEPADVGEAEEACQSKSHVTEDCTGAANP